MADFPSFEFSSNNSNTVGFQLLRNLLDLPHENELRIPDEDDPYKYNENDLQFIRKLSGRVSENMVEEVNHRPTKFPMARKKISIKWNKWTRREDEEARNLYNVIREINIHLRYSPDTDDAVKYLITFYGFGITEFEINIFTEVMDASLSVLMNDIHKNCVSFPPNLLQYIAVVVVKALNYLKSKLNVIHRDIKPDNILYKKGKPGYIKVADFGISRILTNSKATSLVATQIYMPPERIKNSRTEYGVESDIWGIGIVLLELIRNKHPLLNMDEDPRRLSIIEDRLCSLENGFIFERDGNFNDDSFEFISQCLKPFESRPKSYSTLMEMNYIKEFEENSSNWAQYI